VLKKAFTLIEVMAVVLLLGLLATAVVLSMADEVQLARRTDVIDRLSHEDRLARLAARRTGSASVLRFDLDRQRLWRVDYVANEERLTHSWSLPDAYRIEQVLRPGAGSADAVGRIQAAAETTSGIVDVTFSTDGYSETYALRLVHKTGSERRTAGLQDVETIWLVFAGLTGQWTLIQNEDEVNNLFGMLAAPRPDAS
jgi:prepilin-type N-terminal cleavage/methylation domain-containing protein